VLVLSFAACIEEQRMRRVVVLKNHTRSKLMISSD